MATWHDFYAFRDGRVPEGAMLTVKHLLHLGTRHYMDQLLSQSARRTYLTRVAPGVYFKPYRNYEGLPTPAEIARFRLESGGDIVQTHGADAAIGFGIAEAPSEDPRFYTSARTRTLHVGGQRVRFRHAPGVILTHPGTAAGDALAAMHHLGPSRAEEMPAIVEQLMEEDRERIRPLLWMLPDRVVSAWLRADPWAQVPFPPKVARGRRRDEPHLPLRRRRRTGRAAADQE